MENFRKKRVSVVCNNNIDLNPGKASEHLALHSIAARYGYTNFKYFELLSPEEHYSGSARFKSRSVSSDPSVIRCLDQEYCEGFPITYYRLLGHLDEVVRSDAIIFWSSWLHTPVFYDYYTNCLIELSIAADEHQAMDLVNSHLYFTNQPSQVLQKTISFGETVIFNTLRHERGFGYGDAYKSFFSRVRKVYMRDVLSARKVGRLRTEYSGSNTCIDCAMLLRDEDIANLPRSASDVELFNCQNKIAVFFGRSDIDVVTILSMVRMLSDELSMAAFSLPWGVPFSFSQSKSLPFPSPSSDGRRFIRLGDSLSMISRARLVVTDTYHVCVNAWARGVPAICIGNILAHGEFDVNAGYRFASIDKRYLLYVMIEALDFFVHEEEIRDAEFLKAHLHSIVALTNVPEFIEHVRTGLRNEAMAAEERLVCDLDNILAA